MYPKAVEDAIHAFQKLPGVGKKSAQRLAQHILKMPESEVFDFSDALVGLKKDVAFCSRCFNITAKEEPFCAICLDPTRNQDAICVVEEFIDVFAIEQTKTFHGLYHVLQGALSPINGVGPQKLTIMQLLARLENEVITEIVFATNPTMEGDATAMYIKRYIPADKVIQLTRIAKGMPMGGDIDYADEVTLGNSLTQRVVF